MILFSTFIMSSCERNGLYDNATDWATSLFPLNLRGTHSEINVKSGGLDYMNGSTYDFGTSTVGMTGQPVSFSIYNWSKADVTLSGPAAIQISGPDAIDFSNTDPGGVVISPNSSIIFTIGFNPNGAGPRNAQVTINFSGLFRPAYTINLTGMGSTTAVPDINVNVSSNGYSSGATHYFGPVLIGSSSATVTFTLDNIGPGVLNLVGVPAVQLAGADFFDFNLDTTGVVSTILNQWDSVTFTVTFQPTAAGPRKAAIYIYSNDPDLFEEPYVINLDGMGNTPIPDISVQIGGATLDSGGSFDFNRVHANGLGITLGASIINNGTAILNMSNPLYDIIGPNAAEFSVSGLSTWPLAVPTAGPHPFSVTFNPAGIGFKTATLRIYSDDPDENPCFINLIGYGVLPDIDVQILGLTNFPDQPVFTPSAPVQIRIVNTGEFVLNYTASISGLDNLAFTIAGPASGFVPPWPGSGPYSYLDIFITFTPNNGGNYNHNAQLMINSNDPDSFENPVMIPLIGRGL